jgi:glucose-6-phosphate 1-dehydrogenase
MSSAVLANKLRFRTQPAENIKIFAKIAQQGKAVKHGEMQLKP